MFKRLALLLAATCSLSTMTFIAIAHGHTAGSGCTHYHDGTNRILCNDNNNSFTGSDGRDIIWAYGGDDTGDGAGGDDEIHGGGHSDTLRGSNGHDDIYGGGGDSTDRMNGGNGADDLFDRDGLGSFAAPWSKEVDIICAGTDEYLDFIDVRDGDMDDKIYVHLGEDEYEIDRVYQSGVWNQDLVLPANDCPISE